MTRSVLRGLGLLLAGWLIVTPVESIAAPLAISSTGRPEPAPLRATRAPRPPLASQPSDATIVAAGDIACDPANALFNDGGGAGQYCRAAAVARVIRAADPDGVLALGDEQYDTGLLRSFRRSYDLSWGRERFRTYPVPGNHEYEASRHAEGYFDYYGSRAGPNRHGWYAVTLGAWRLIALNSNCMSVGCRGGSPQYRWLRDQLRDRPAACTLAFMHHPLVSSGPHGDDEMGARPLWRLLYAFGVDVALVGHDHIYERFAPVDPRGVKDKAYGVREFVVGTGGAMHYGIDEVHRYSQVHNTTAFGVLRLTLRRGAYDWKFLPAAGATFTDGGTGRCHGAP
jgi:Calcineurin-like phosphoesterase